MNRGARTEPLKLVDPDPCPGLHDRSDDLSESPDPERVLPSSRSPARTGSGTRRSAAEVRSAYRSNEAGRRMVVLLAMRQTASSSLGMQASQPVVRAAPAGRGSSAGETPLTALS